jgi:hypothetical protein
MQAQGRSAARARSTRLLGAFRARIGAGPSGDHISDVSDDDVTWSSDHVRVTVPIL